MTNTTTTISSLADIRRAIIALAPLIFLGLAALFIAGCGPEFDPASLVKTTRVVGARIEVEGAPDRASPVPGETANVTWLVTSPDVPPPLAWAFAACLRETVDGRSPRDCLSSPLARFDGTATPRIAIPVPAGPALGTATRLVVYGQLCSGAGSVPNVDAQNAVQGCTGGRGTTVSLEIPVQLGNDANHNPIADRAFTFDGAVWPAPATGDDPCAVGPRVAAGSAGHIIGNTTDGSDREAYTTFAGIPPVPTPTRERLQISQFVTAGELSSQFSFVESDDDRAATSVEGTWDAPEEAAVPAGTLVTFTFVVRDDRGGTDWATRTLCVTP